jgi:hypothetical protein
MSASMNIFSDMNMKSSSFRLHEFVGFPPNPKPGELAVVDNALFSYIELEGILQWVPLTNKREYMMHIQETLSDTWIVEHNLGTYDYVYTIFDDTNTMHLATATNLTIDSFQLTFAQPIRGRVAVLGSSSKFAGYQSCAQTQKLYETITFGVDEPTGDEDSILYFQIEEV